MAVFSQKSQEMKWQRRISARENHTALPCRHVHDKLGPPSLLLSSILLM